MRMAFKCQITFHKIDFSVLWEDKGCAPVLNIKGLQDKIAFSGSVFCDLRSRTLAGNPDLDFRKPWLEKLKPSAWCFKRMSFCANHRSLFDCSAKHCSLIRSRMERPRQFHPQKISLLTVGDGISSLFSCFHFVESWQPLTKPMGQTWQVASPLSSRLCPPLLTFSPTEHYLHRLLFVVPCGCQRPSTCGAWHS